MIKYYKQIIDNNGNMERNIHIFKVRDNSFVLHINITCMLINRLDYEYFDKKIKTEFPIKEITEQEFIDHRSEVLHYLDII